MSNPSNVKLDAILKRLDKLDTLDNVAAKLDTLSATVNTISESVAALQAQVQDNTSDIAAMRRDFELFKTESYIEIRSVKNTLNFRDQQLRGAQLRLFNFPVSTDDTAGLAARVYDRVLRPLLAAAKAAGEISAVPQVQNAIEACYRCYTQEEPKEGQPLPPIVVKLANRQLKIAAMKQRKLNLLQPSEGERKSGCKRFVLVEDLTPPAHKLLKALQADQRTDKVWSVNGQIHFSVPGKSGFKKVRSVFDNIESILG